MVLKSLLTTRPVSRSHSVGTLTWPSKPGSVASYASRSRVKPLTGSGPWVSRKAQPRPSRGPST